jgi:hypothetical protein
VLLGTRTFTASLCNIKIEVEETLFHRSKVRPCPDAGLPTARENAPPTSAAK